MFYITDTCSQAAGLSQRLDYGLQDRRYAIK